MRQKVIQTTIVLAVTIWLLFMFENFLFNSQSRAFQVAVTERFGRKSEETSPKYPIYDTEDRITRERAQHVLKQCQEPMIRQTISARPRKHRHFITRPFLLCAVPKGGSTSWLTTMEMLSSWTNETREDLRVLVTRHPLTRLASAYRDKYLNGSPLWAYNETFRRLTGSEQTWDDRWTQYWLPALISRGSVDPTPGFLRALEEARRALRYLLEKADEGGLLQEEDEEEASKLYTREGLETASKMLLRDPRCGLRAALEAGFPASLLSRLRERFADASFTFVEFLEHVAWTWRMGVSDRHWSPIAQLCSPCDNNYSRVLHVENPRESSFVLQGLLGGRPTEVARKHVSLGPKDPRWYYARVPEDLMAEIADMYWVDFRMFGYEGLKGQAF